MKITFRIIVTVVLCAVVWLLNLHVHDWVISILLVLGLLGFIMSVASVNQLMKMEAVVKDLVDIIKKTFGK